MFDFQEDKVDRLEYALRVLLQLRPSIGTQMSPRTPTYSRAELREGSPPIRAMSAGDASG